jgi:ureidoglycolate hydrolase
LAAVYLYLRDRYAPRLRPVDADPMLAFDKRDLLELTHAAGFAQTHLELRCDVGPPAPQAWEAFIRVPTIPPRHPTSTPHARHGLPLFVNHLDAAVYVPTQPQQNRVDSASHPPTSQTLPVGSLVASTLGLKGETMAATPTRQLREIVLKARPLTPDVFAPYGRIIAEDRLPLEQLGGHFTANVAVLGLVPDHLGGINRHMDHTQLFIPLRGARTLVVVAAPDVPMDGFVPDRLAAFVADGTFAYTFDAGTWHIEPKAIDPANNRVINVQSDVYRAYTELIRFDEASGVRVKLVL